MTKRARGTDGAAGNRFVIAPANQCRQGQESQRDHRGTDNASRCSHEYAEQNNAHPHATANAAREMAHHIQQIIGEPRLFEHDPHKHKQWNRKPLVARNDPK